MSTRLASVGLHSLQTEALPWTTGDTSMEVRDAAGAVLDTISATLTDGMFSATVPATYTGEPGQVTLRWTSDGQWVEHTLDVRAGLVWPLDLLEQFLNDGSEGVSDEYPEWKQRRELAGALLDLEATCRTALVPRRSVEAVTSGTGCTIEVDQAYPVALVACSDPAVDVSSAVVAKYDGTVRFAGSVSAPLTITYDHGLSVCAEHAGLRVLALLAADRLKSGPADDRGFLIHGDLGAVRVMTPGVSGAMFSIPEVQAFYLKYRVTIL